MINKLILTGSFLLLLLTTRCVNKSQKIENIQSFAKVYGYVRWFYPGDEAAQLNWTKFAILGINKVENARNQKELKAILLDLFKPIAPSIQIYDSRHTVKFDLQSITPPDPLDYKVVSWKHYGVLLGEQSNIYQSIRINRDTITSKNICLVNYLLDISKYGNKEVKMVVSMKAQPESKGDVSLCLTSMQVLGPNYLNVLKRQSRIVKPTDKWGEFETIIKVKQYDDYILCGLDLNEMDSLSVSEIKLLVRENNAWKPIEKFTVDFEQAYWEKNKFLYDFKIDSSKQKNKKEVVEITSTTQATKIGEFIRKDIGNNLVCLMPLALYGTRVHTFPGPDTISFKELKQQLINIPNSTLTTEYLNARLANIVIAWNVFQHFYPYFDVVHVDWGKALSNSLKDVYDGKTESDYFKTMCRMIAKLEDGHGYVNCNNVVQWGLPVSFAWIENNVVISGSKSALFQRGDIIKSIDGRSAIDELVEQERLVSGSPQLKRYRALNIFGSDFSQREAKVTLIRDGKILDLKATRDLRCNLFFNPIAIKNPKSEECANGIYYENSRQTDFDKELGYLVKAKGIIVDPLSDHSKIIPHLIKGPVWSAFWNIPIARYPDRENVIFSTSQGKINPEKPYLSAKIAFIEEPFNVSSGETYLSFIVHYKLGKLIGDTTAGTNGNVNYISLMGGYSIMWTGMKVLKQDSSQHHLIGYRPDYPVKRTIKAIKENRDEYLEKAIEILEN